MRIRSAYVIPFVSSACRKEYATRPVRNRALARGSCRPRAAGIAAATTAAPEVVKKLRRSIVQLPRSERTPFKPGRDLVSEAKRRNFVVGMIVCVRLLRQQL